jgi:hypothetical protein
MSQAPKDLPHYADAVKFGKQLGKEHGKVWEKWTDSKPFVQTIIREAVAHAGQLAWATYPMGGWWFLNAEIISFYVLAPLGFLTPIAVLAIVAQLDQVPDGILAITLALLVAALWIPMKLLKLPESANNGKYGKLRNSLAEVMYNAAYNEVHSGRQGSESENPNDWLISVSSMWQPLCPKPSPYQSELEPSEAETYVQSWMLFLGASGAKVTQYSQDGGIDVESDYWVAQVKHYIDSVSVQPVREILGVATSRGKRACFFTKTGYTKEAVRFAEENEIPLFQYESATAELVPWSSSAAGVLETGLA